jgi:hypothetical protein
MMTVWYAGWKETVSFYPAYQIIPESHPYRITSTKYHINTVVSLDDGHSHLKHVKKRNKQTKNNCAPSWLY